MTSDSSVLACATELRRRYGIEVISPESFQVDRPDEASHEAHSAILGLVLAFEPVAPQDETEIQALLSGLDVDIGAQTASWAAVDGNRSICSRFVVKNDERVIGYLVWPSTLSGGQINACMAVDEEAVAAQDAVRLMLNHLADQVGRSEVARIRLSCPPRQVVLREVAAEFGYTGASSGKNELQKVMVKCIVSNENWKTIKSLLLGSCEVMLPDTPPTFRHVDQQIPVVRPDGERPLVSLFTLETLLAPVLFCLPGREGVLVSLQPQFAAQLLQHSPQVSLLPRARAQLFHQRHYLSGPATLKTFTRGDLIFFYESGKGANAVVAVGRVIRSYHRHEAALSTVDLNPSVLDSGQLVAIGKAKVKTITVFDNLLLLSQTVSREDLVELRCGEPHQLQTSQRLNSQQVQGILCKGLR